MKKWIFLFTLVFNGLFAAPIQERRIDPNAMNALLSATGISKDANLVEETQKYWLRKPNLERWEMAELSAEQRTFVLNWGIEQGFFSSWKPYLQTYDNALILGATTSRMQLRLDYLKQLWAEGLRFSQIVWLTGDRPLDERVDCLTERCKTESEAARIIWEETDLPEEFRQLPVVFIAVPMKKGGMRPNTQDTIYAWIEREPNPCTALFVSDQPFCGYQYAVINACLPDRFAFDLIGQEVNPFGHPSAASIFLDSLARWIFMESLGKQQK